MTDSIFDDAPDVGVTPTNVRRDGEDAIVFDWSDGTQTRWTAAALRKQCPCATCREKRRGEHEKTTSGPLQLPMLSAAEAAPLRIETLRPIGNYAYNIVFSDGHHSGLFVFASLKG